MARVLIKEVAVGPHGADRKVFWWKVELRYLGMNDLPSQDLPKKSV